MSAEPSPQPESEVTPTALTETAYLLSSPENARRLLASIDELETGGGTVHGRD